MPAKQRPTLSACLIVKNEEKFLAQCLESIQSAVDEIIIVDTGSTDSTVEIARRYTDKVYFHAWNHSFSEARNVSLSYATCDWILQIDADETLEQADIPLLHAVLVSDLYNAVFVAIYNIFDSARSKHYFQRIFRRGQAHFAGIVHNQLQVRGASAASEIRLYHYGYNLASGDMQKKYERTGELLRRQIAADPNNTFAYMNLVRVYRAQEKYELAVATGEEAIARNSPNTTGHHKQMIWSDIAVCYLVLNRYDEADATCRKALAENAENLDVLFALGGVNLQRGNHLDAIHWYKRFLEVKRTEAATPRYSPLIVDTYSFEDKVYNNLGECYRMLGLKDKAVESYRAAIVYNASDVNSHRNLGTFYVHQGDGARAAETFQHAIELGIADAYVWHWTGELARRAGHFAEAETAFRQAIAKDSAGIDPHHSLALCLLQQGRAAEAEPEIQAALAAAPVHIGLLVTYGRIMAALGRKAELAQVVEQIESLGYRDVGLRRELAGLLMQNGMAAPAQTLFEKYLEQQPEDVAALTDLSTCYAQQGHYSSALAGYKAALQLQPGYQPAIGNLRRLQSRLAQEMANAVPEKIAAC